MQCLDWKRVRKTYLETLRDWGLSIEEEDLLIPLSSVTKHENVQDFFECPHTFSEDVNFSHRNLSPKGHRLVYWNLCDLTHPALVGANKAAQEAAQEAFWAVYLAEVLQAYDCQMEWEIIALRLTPDVEPLAKEFVEYTPKATSHEKFIEIGKRFGVENVFDTVKERRRENLKRHAPALKQLVSDFFNFGDLVEGEPSAYVKFRGFTPLLNEIFEIIYPSATLTRMVTSGSYSWPDNPETLYLVPFKNFDWGLTDWDLVSGEEKLFDPRETAFFKDDMNGWSQRRGISLLTEQYNTNLCGPIRGYISPSCTPEFAETVNVLSKEMDFAEALKSALALTS